MFCYHAECRILFAIMLNVIMLSFVILNVIMLSVVMLSVVAPLFDLCSDNIGGHNF
jgi:hypothetical protein